MITIVSHASDEHTQAVMNELRARSSDVLLLDLASFPQHMRVALSYTGDGEDIRFLENDHDIALSDSRAVWWRRPTTFVPDPRITRPTHVQFVLNECAEVMSGLWPLIGARWMNHPQRDERAARKAYQLKVAREVGLKTPRTLITNDPAYAKSFVDELGVGHVIYKTFSATQQEWRETRLVGADELALLDNVRFAPVIFQEYVAAVVDVRATVVGKEVFAAAIHSQSSAYKVDFRMDMANTEVEPIVLPKRVTAALLRLMTSLDLVYGAIDMRLTPDGEHVFLEINPSGQWLFIEARTGQPITEAVAERLIALDSRRQPRARSGAHYFTARSATRADGG